MGAMRVAGVILGVVAAGGVARAQLLDLESDAPARPDTNVAARALLDRVDRSWSEDASDPDAPGAVVRRLMRSMTQRVLDAGSRGAAQLLVVRTIDANLASLDRLLDAGRVDDALLALLAHDLDLVDRDIPLDPVSLDRLLRDAFAQILGRTGEPDHAWGWVAEARPSPDLEALDEAHLETLATFSGVSSGSVDVLREMVPTLEEALAWPAYEREARATLAAIVDALDVVTIERAWVAQTTRDALGLELDRALAGLVRDREAALVRLRTLGELAAVLELSESLPPGRDAERVREALAASAGTLDRLAPRLGDLRRAMELAMALERVEPERAIVRQLRPIRRGAMVEADRTEGLLMRSLPAIVQREDALSDPGVVAAIGAHRRSIDDLHAIESISAALSDATAATPEPIVRADRRRLADRLLVLTRDDEDRDAAVAMLRELAGQIARYETLPGEERLRDAARRASTGTLVGPEQFWGEATGFRQGELVAMIDRERGAFWEAWSDQFQLGGQPADFADLDALAMLCETLAAAQLVAAQAASPGVVRSALQAWPGYELSASALAALRPDAAALAEASRFAVAERPGDALDVLRALREEDPTFLVIAELEREAGALGLARTTDDADVLYELATGSPVAGSWRADDRERIAEICRWAEELAAMVSLRDERREEEVRAYVAYLARELAD